MKETIFKNKANKNILFIILIIISIISAYYLAKNYCFEAFCLTKYFIIYLIILILFSFILSRVINFFIKK